MVSGPVNLIAYLRVSSEAQDTQLQRDALGEAGCVKFFTDGPLPWPRRAATQPSREARHTGDVVKFVSLATYAWRAAGRLAT